MRRRFFLPLLLSSLAAAAATGGRLAPAARGQEGAAARAYVVADAASGHILDQANPDQKLQVASLTKIATVVLVLDWSDSSHRGLDQLVTVPAAALSVGGVNPVGLQAGDQASIRDLIYAMLLQSDNVAAETVALHVGRQIEESAGGAAARGAGPEVAFVAQMNALAANLGMARTRFLNPTGLDAKERPFSTAADLARLTKYALTKPAFRFFVAQKERRIEILRAGQPAGFLLRNTNDLVGVSNVDGVKTGQSSRAGGCLVLTAAREPIVRIISDSQSEIARRRLIVVLLGSGDRFREGLGLLTRGTSLYDAWVTQGRPTDPKQNL